MMKKLYLSDNDKKISGVCGGIGEYFQIDSTIIRLVWIVISIPTGFVPGIIAYFIAAAIMPKPPKIEIFEEDN